MRHDDQIDALAYAFRVMMARQQRRWRFGWLFRWGSLWVGAHWSRKNRRLCVNVIPCVTFWVTPPGGKTPEEDR